MIRSTALRRLERTLVIAICLALVSSSFLIGISDGSWPVGHEERIRYGVG